MWNVLRVLPTFLCAQVCVGQITYRTLRAVDRNGLHVGLPASPNRGGAAHRQEWEEIKTEEYGFEREVGATTGRELQDGVCILIVTFNLPSADGLGFSTTTIIKSGWQIAGSTGGWTAYFMEIEIAPDGVTVAQFTVRGLTDSEADNYCSDGSCIQKATFGVCVSGDCDNYDQDLANSDMALVSIVCGDPHMVGLLGQKIDWVGEDGGWYCLVSDVGGFQLNVRVTAPMPEEFPDRQLISGVSLLLPNGHSLVVEVKNPYTIETDGCLDDTHSPCLADGALRILVDNEETPGLQIPAENVVLPEGVVWSATNLPAECRPFGGDLIWAAQFEQLMQGRRSLRAASATLNEWVLGPDTLAAPTWCAQYLEGGVADLLASQSNHATFRVETPTVDLRINIGVNHQELVVAADGITVVVPELEFWQTDIALERHNFYDSVGGMLGDTSRFVYDSDGNSITEGLEALHGAVESYRVTDALGVEFDKLNH